MTKQKHASYCPYCDEKVIWYGEENTVNVNTHIKKKHIGVKDE